MEIAQVFLFNRRIVITKELPPNMELGSMMSRIMSLHQPMQSEVAMKPRREPMMTKVTVFITNS